MVRTVLTMLVRPGHEREFERIWQSFAERIAQQPGNVGQTLMSDQGQPRSYVIASDWFSGEALRSFETSELRQALSGALDPLRESASKAVLDVVVTVKGKEHQQS
jgi:quinol monooxygenase YgiN